MDCGPTCLRMVAKYFGKDYSLKKLKEYCHISREGVSLLGISDAAEKIGFHTLAVRMDIDKLFKEAPLPCIVHWNQEHFVVLYKIEKNAIFISDPAHGLVKLNKNDFQKAWAVDFKKDKPVGIALLLEPTPIFYDFDGEEKQAQKGFHFLFSYLFPYKKLIVQLILAMLIGTLLQLMFPFLTQSVVDFGINYRDISFIYLILVAQLMLFLGRATVDFIRSWILLHIGTRVNISLVSDFLIKLMKLPIAYFDSKLTGDILQRVNDHYRIEQFLTANTLSTLFSFFNLIVFGFVLAVYNLPIFGIFMLGSLVYTLWIVLLMKRRRDIDYRRFNSSRENQDNLIQLIHGMQEIKLQNSEKQKRWEWEEIQAKLFKVSVSTLKLNQYQQAGAVFINELKNIIITFLAAKAVIDGQMTLGMMLSVQYIIGQLNSPIENMIGFMQAAQDAKLSLERLSEIHLRKEEEENKHEKIQDLPFDKSIYLNKITFNYEGAMDEKVLKDVNLNILQGKITAIVGTSGSGKTTLLKMLLKFYEPQSGNLKVGNYELNNISNKLWRSKCGAVMQDGFIFSDTIARNIAVGEDKVDKKMMLKAVEIANIHEFIETLPLGYNTKIGMDGHGLSQGQKQRILIARAVYKNPEYLFFDEATNALDSKNEKLIMEKLNIFFKGKTVVIVAHRLSTVKNADQILVLEKGQLVEMGTHLSLAAMKGNYYTLVKNQLELGN